MGIAFSGDLEGVEKIFFFLSALKILSKTFCYLHLFERIFSSSLKRWFSCSFCVFLLHFRGSFSHKKDIKKAGGVIFVRSVLEKTCFKFYWKEMNGNFLTNHRLDKDMAMWRFESCSKPSLALDKRSINFFQKLYLPLHMYYRTLLEWFLIAFLQTIYGHGCIAKNRKKHGSYNQCQSL